MTIFGGPKSRQHSNPAQPLLRDHAVAAVAEPDQGLASPQGLEQRGQLGPGVAILRAAAQLEPIDSRGNFDAKATGASEQFSLSLDMPARLHQRSRHRRELARRELPAVVLSAVSPTLSLQSQIHELFCGSVFRGGITQNEAVLSRIVKSAASITRWNYTVLIIKRELRLQPSAAVLRRPLTAHPQARLGDQSGFLVLEFGRHLQRRQA